MSAFSPPLRSLTETFSWPQSQAGSKDVDKLFHLLRLPNHIRPPLRGIGALRSPDALDSFSSIEDLVSRYPADDYSDTENLAQSTRSYRRGGRGRPDSVATPLSIHLVKATEGHIAVTFARGKYLCVFDAVPSGHQLSLADVERLAIAVRSCAPLDPPIPGVLALPVTDSPIVALDFITTPEPSSSPTTTHHPNQLTRLHFLTVQTSGTVSAWYWRQDRLSFIFHAMFPLPLDAYSYLARTIIRSSQSSSSSPSTTFPSDSSNPSGRTTSNLNDSHIPPLSFNNLPSSPLSTEASIVPVTVESAMCTPDGRYVVWIDRTPSPIGPLASTGSGSSTDSGMTAYYTVCLALIPFNSKSQITKRERIPYSPISSHVDQGKPSNTSTFAPPLSSPPLPSPSTSSSPSTSAELTFNATSDSTPVISPSSVTTDPPTPSTTSSSSPSPTTSSSSSTTLSSPSSADAIHDVPSTSSTVPDTSAITSSSPTSLNSSTPSSPSEVTTATSVPPTSTSSRLLPSAPCAPPNWIARVPLSFPNHPPSIYPSNHGIYIVSSPSLTEYQSLSSLLLPTTSHSTQRLWYVSYQDLVDYTLIRTQQQASHTSRSYPSPTSSSTPFTSISSQVSSTSLNYASDVALSATSLTCPVHLLQDEYLPLGNPSASPSTPLRLFALHSATNHFFSLNAQGDVTLFKEKNNGLPPLQIRKCRVAPDPWSFEWMPVSEPNSLLSSSGFSTSTSFQPSTQETSILPPSRHFTPHLRHLRDYPSIPLSRLLIFSHFAAILHPVEDRDLVLPWSPSTSSDTSRVLPVAPIPPHIQKAIKQQLQQQQQQHQHQHQHQHQQQSVLGTLDLDLPPTPVIPRVKVSSYVRSSFVLRIFSLFTGAPMGLCVLPLGPCPLRSTFSTRFALGGSGIGLASSGGLWFLTTPSGMASPINEIGAVINKVPVPLPTASLPLRQSNSQCPGNSPSSLTSLSKSPLPNHTHALPIPTSPLPNAISAAINASRLSPSPLGPVEGIFHLLQILSLSSSPSVRSLALTCAHYLVASNSTTPSPSTSSISTVPSLRYTVAGIPLRYPLSSSVQRSLPPHISCVYFLADNLPSVYFSSSLNTGNRLPHPFLTSISSSTDDPSFLHAAYRIISTLSSELHSPALPIAALSRSSLTYQLLLSLLDKYTESLKTKMEATTSFTVPLSPLLRRTRRCLKLLIALQALPYAFLPNLKPTSFLHSSSTPMNTLSFDRQQHSTDQPTPIRNNLSSPILPNVANVPQSSTQSTSPYDPLQSIGFRFTRGATTAVKTMLVGCLTSLLSISFTVKSEISRAFIGPITRHAVIQRPLREIPVIPDTSTINSPPTNRNVSLDERSSPSPPPQDLHTTSGSVDVTSLDNHDALSRRTLSHSQNTSARFSISDTQVTSSASPNQRLTSPLQTLYLPVNRSLESLMQLEPAAALKHLMDRLGLAPLEDAVSWPVLTGSDRSKLVGVYYPDYQSLASPVWRKPTVPCSPSLLVWKARTETGSVIASQLAHQAAVAYALAYAVRAGNSLHTANKRGGSKARAHARQIAQLAAAAAAAANAAASGKHTLAGADADPLGSGSTPMFEVITSLLYDERPELLFSFVRLVAESAPSSYNHASTIKHEYSPRVVSFAPNKDEVTQVLAKEAVNVVNRASEILQHAEVKENGHQTRLLPNVGNTDPPTPTPTSGATSGVDSQSKGNGIASLSPMTSISLSAGLVPYSFPPLSTPFSSISSPSSPSSLGPLMSDHPSMYSLSLIRQCIPRSTSINAIPPTWPYAIWQQPIVPQTSVSDCFFSRALDALPSPSSIIASCSKRWSVSLYPHDAQSDDGDTRRPMNSKVLTVPACHTSTVLDMLHNPTLISTSNTSSSTTSTSTSPSQSNPRTLPLPPRPTPITASRSQIMCLVSLLIAAGRMTDAVRFLVAIVACMRACANDLILIASLSRRPALPHTTNGATATQCSDVPDKGEELNSSDIILAREWFASADYYEEEAICIANWFQVWSKACLKAPSILSSHSCHKYSSGGSQANTPMSLAHFTREQHQIAVLERQGRGRLRALRSELFTLLFNAFISRGDFSTKEIATNDSTTRRPPSLDKRILALAPKDFSVSTLFSSVATHMEASHASQPLRPTSTGSSNKNDASLRNMNSVGKLTVSQLHDIGETGVRVTAPTPLYSHLASHLPFRSTPQGDDSLNQDSTMSPSSSLAQSHIHPFGVLDGDMQFGQIQGLLQTLLS